MSEQFTFRQCPNPDCQMRFPAGKTIPADIPCPRCGKTTQVVRSLPRSPRVEPGDPVVGGPDIYLLMDNIRSAFNVGSMLRTADGAGVRHAYLCGISPTPENPKVSKTGLSAEFSVDWSYSPNSLLTARSLASQGISLWALEGGEKAQPITAHLPLAAGQKVALIAGNELAGVDPDLLELCDRVVFLPMIGFKRSLNVAVAAGIALYLIRYSGSTFHDRID